MVFIYSIFFMVINDGDMKENFRLKYFKEKKLV